MSFMILYMVGLVAVLVLGSVIVAILDVASNID